MISRRTISFAGGASLLVGQRLGRAQAGAPMRRVGWLSFFSPSSNPYSTDALKQGMHELGWVEGRNVEYRFTFANDDEKRLDPLAAELVAQKVDVIIVSTFPDAQAAKRATKSIPIVGIMIPDMVRMGLVESLARPGGNMTGNTSIDDLTPKIIELLHQIAPRARRYAVLGADTFRPAFWPIIQKACSALGLEALLWGDITRLEQFEAAVAQLVTERADAVVLFGSGAAFTYHVRLFELLQKTRLPVACTLSQWVRAGGLVSYSAQFDEVARLRSAARFVDKIFKGAKPGDIPVEQPTKFDMVLNMKTAKALGLTIPYGVMLRATEVIE